MGVTFSPYSGFYTFYRKGEELPVPYLLEKGGGISHLVRQIMKVLEPEGVGMEEFFNDLSTSKKKYLHALHWELRDLPLIKRQLVHQITKSDWMP